MPALIPRPAAVKVGAVLALIAATLGLFSETLRYRPAGDELLANGDFRDGLEAWTASPPGAVVITGREGVTLSALENGKPARLGQFAAFPETGDRRGVRATATARTEGVRPGGRDGNTAYLYVVCRDADGRNLYARGFLSWLVPEDREGWHTFVKTLAVPRAAVGCLADASLFATQGVLRVRAFSLRPLVERPNWHVWRIGLGAFWFAVLIWIAVPLLRSTGSKAVRVVLAVATLAVLTGVLLPRARRDDLVKMAMTLLERARGSLLEAFPWLSAWLPVPETAAHFSVLAVGHAVLFAVLAVIARIWRPGLRIWTTALYLAVFAAATETLQLFADRRTPSLHDLLVDMAGVLVGLAVAEAARKGRFLSRRNGKTR